jgi:hypothetical protein
MQIADVCDNRLGASQNLVIAKLTIVMAFGLSIRTIVLWRGNGLIESFSSRLNESALSALNVW